MKTLTNPEVDDYISGCAAFAQPILRRLRQLVHQACPTAEEAIKWSRPFFLLNGKPLANMAAFKAHATFGFWHQEMRGALEELTRKKESAAGDFGRIEQQTDLPADTTLLRLIEQAAKLTVSNIPAKPPVQPRPFPAIPAALAEGLKKNKAAAANFSKFSPSHQREYIEWIAEAKQEATRAKRVTTSLAWLAEGKSRNWKYKNC